MRRCKGVLLAGMLVLSMSVPVYADKSVVVKVEAPADTTDYYMTVDSGGVGVDIYPSTDEKGEKLNDKTVKDGTVLHIEGETEKNGETWGYTEYNGRYGYVPLEELRPSRDAELVKAGIAGRNIRYTELFSRRDSGGSSRDGQHRQRSGSEWRKTGNVCRDGQHRQLTGSEWRRTGSVCRDGQHGEFAVSEWRRTGNVCRDGQHRQLAGSERRGPGTTCGVGQNRQLTGSER